MLFLVFASEAELVQGFTLTTCHSKALVKNESFTLLWVAFDGETTSFHKVSMAGFAHIFWLKAL
jgi:hypothetical protein